MVDEDMKVKIRRGLSELDALPTEEAIRAGESLHKSMSQVHWEDAFKPFTM